MREKELKEALGKLIKQTKRSQNWIIKEDTEVTELAEDLGNILRLELKISAGKYDAAIIHAEKHFLKEAGHEAKTVSRIEKRMDRFCGRLIDALDHYIELETALGRTEELATLRKHRAETDLYKKDLINKLSWNGELHKLLSKKPINWEEINAVVKETLSHLKALLILITDLGKLWDEKKREDVKEGTTLLYREGMNAESFKIDLEVAQFLASMANTVFYEKKSWIDSQGIFSDIQLSKHQAIGGGDYIAKHIIESRIHGCGLLDGKLLVANLMIGHLLYDIINATYNYASHGQYEDFTGFSFWDKKDFVLPKNKENILRSVISYLCTYSSKWGLTSGIGYKVSAVANLCNDEYQHFFKVMEKYASVSKESVPLIARGREKAIWGELIALWKKFYPREEASELLARGEFEAYGNFVQKEVSRRTLKFAGIG